MKTAGKVLVCHYKQCSWYCYHPTRDAFSSFSWCCAHLPSHVSAASLRSVGPLWWEGVQACPPLPGWGGLQAQPVPHCSLAQTSPPPCFTLCTDILRLGSPASLCCSLRPRYSCTQYLLLHRNTSSCWSLCKTIVVPY